MSEDKKLEGLNGWLILVGLGIVISPFRYVFELYPVYSNIIWTNESLAAYEAYHPFALSFLIGEIVINCGIVFTWGLVAFLFFSKKSAFPQWWIGLNLFSLLIIFLDVLVASILSPNEPIFDYDTTKVLIQSILQSMIWIPYMLLSKRVKATFVR